MTAQPGAHADVFDRPGSAEEAVALVRRARREGRPVVLRGRGTRNGWLPAPPPRAVVVETTGLADEGRLRPRNLTAVFGAGTPLSDVHRRLAADGLWLPLEDLEGDTTLGGSLAAGAVDPLLGGLGPPRDWVLGVTVVDPSGRLLRLGSELMKDVAGYDLTHLHLGAWGRLGLLTEVVVRLLPRPPTQAALLARFDSPAAAEAAVVRLLRAGRRPAALDVRAAPGGASLVARVVGEKTAVAASIRTLAGLIEAAGKVTGADSVELSPPEVDAAQEARADWLALQSRFPGRCRISVRAPGLARLAGLAGRLGLRDWALRGQATAGVYRLFWRSDEPPEWVLDGLARLLGGSGSLVAEATTAAYLAGLTRAGSESGWVAFPPRQPRSQDGLESRVLAALAGGEPFNPHLPGPPAPGSVSAGAPA
jgi:FAD/FMN-containing dehydrogenase